MTTTRGPGRPRGLLAYPAQSNFTGVQHPLHWIELGHERGYDGLLDAAAYLPTNILDLSAVKPDFVVMSWYKVFGYPTGVGCLVARASTCCRGSPVCDTATVHRWYGSTVRRTSATAAAR